MLPVEQPYKVYTGLDGKPLDQGYVYFGQPDLNPANPAQQITVYWDAAGTQPAVQPLRTVNGYIVRAGTPANVFVGVAYSELVQDKQQRQVAYARTSAEFSIASVVSAFISNMASSIGASLVGFIQSGVAAVQRTVQDKLRESVSVKDFGAKCDGVTDDTAAVQAALNAHQVVYFPGNCRVTAPLTITQPYAVLYGDGKYTGSAITMNRAGAGIILTCDAATIYPSIRGMQIKWIPTVGTDFFNTGTVGLDVTAANTSPDLSDVWFQGCEIPLKGNYNGFYTKVDNCRFEQCLYPLYHFSINNLQVTRTRFKEFKDALTLNGTGGPANIKGNSFEVFNGYLVSMTGVEQGVVNFHDNYVEIYDNENLPTNFPTAANALPGKFGGNVLFGGPYGTLSVKNNEMGLGGVYIIGSLSLCGRLESVGNNLHFHTATSNLRYMWNLPTVKSCVVKDRAGLPVAPNGGYATVYDQANNIPLLDSPFGEFEFFDPPTGNFLLCPSHKYAPALLNGWTSPGAPDGVPAVVYTDKGLFLQGEATGTARTGDIIFTLPAAQRPLNFSSNRSYCFLTTTSDEGSGVTVQLRYLYGSGDFRLENVPASTNNIVLDGLFIPSRI